MRGSTQRGRNGGVPGKSMVPLLSASTSLIMSWSSDSLGFWPRERMTVPSSLVVICPKIAACQSHARVMTVSRVWFRPWWQCGGGVDAVHRQQLRGGQRGSAKALRTVVMAGARAKGEDCGFSGHHVPSPSLSCRQQQQSVKGFLVWRELRKQGASKGMVRATYEEGECLLELGDLLLGERVSLFVVGGLAKWWGAQRQRQSRGRRTIVFGSG